LRRFSNVRRTEVESDHLASEVLREEYRALAFAARHVENTQPGPQFEQFAEAARQIKSAGMK